MTRSSCKIIYITSILGRWGEVVLILKRFLSTFVNYWSRLEDPILTLRELSNHQSLFYIQVMPSVCWYLTQLRCIVAVPLKEIRGLWRREYKE